MSSPSTANGTTTVRPLTQKQSKMATVTTILAACPLWDVIAMLVLLLQLPPTLISVIHGVFAVLTFVPNSANFSFGNLPSLHELMAVDPAGAPSMQTVLLVDAFLMLCFVWLAVPAQNILLELAQVVIAITLGGAAASQGRATSSLIMCLTIIAFSHVTRWNTARQFGFAFLTSTVSGASSTESPEYDGSRHSNRLWLPPGKVRSVLGAHILAQGILKGVRRYISSSKTQSHVRSILKKNDGDSISSTITTPKTISNPPESNSESGLHATGDGRPPGQPPNNVVKEKLMNLKRKNKKYATQVRVQQPLWSLVAKGKLQVAQGYDGTRPNQDSQDAHAVNMSNLGSVEFANTGNRVWLGDIGATEVTLGVSLLHDSEERNSSAKSRGWYIKINGASYPIKAKMIDKLEVMDDVLETWEAKIYGLNPLAPYHCEVLTDFDTTIYETHLVTQSAPSMETITSLPTAVPVLQPSSPVATLRSSIRGIESEAEKSKNQVRSSRKQHKTALERLQSQIDRETAKFSNTGGTDERQRQRAKQLDKSIAKVRAETQEAQERLSQMGDIPTDQRQKYSKARDEAKSRRKKMDARKSAFDRSKRESDKLVTAAKADIDTLIHKRTRFESRQKEYSSKLAEATRRADQAALAKSLRLRKEQEHAAARRQAMNSWEQFQEETERSVNDDAQTHYLAQQGIKQYQDWAEIWNLSPNDTEIPEQQASAVPPGLLGPSNISSNSLPGTRPHSLHVSANGFSPSFIFPPASSAFPNVNSVGFRGNGVKVQHRRRASSSSDLQQHNGSMSNLNSPYANASFQPPAGYDAFSAAKSSALLSNLTNNSTPLFPAGRASTFPKFSSHGLKSTPTPVGEGRRKGSGGSGHSLRGTADSDNGSPKISNGTIGSGLRNGVVSPPSSANWDMDGHR